MCAMNQQRWSDVYEERLEDPALARAAQPGDRTAALPGAVAESVGAAPGTF